MQYDAGILQSSIPEDVCEAFLSWTLCTYYFDPVIVSVIVLAAVAVGIVFFMRKMKRSKNLR